jgi:hypothetical protein
MGCSHAPQSMSRLLGLKGGHTWEHVFLRNWNSDSKKFMGMFWDF